MLASAQVAVLSRVLRVVALILSNWSVYLYRAEPRRELVPDFEEAGRAIARRG